MKKQFILTLILVAALTVTGTWAILITLTI